MCKNDHVIPENGYSNNIELEEILNSKGHLTKEQNQLDENLKSLKESIDEFNKLMDNSEAYIFDELSEIKNKIDLRREKLFIRYQIT